MLCNPGHGLAKGEIVFLHHKLDGSPGLIVGATLILDHPDAFLICEYGTGRILIIRPDLESLPATGGKAGLRLWIDIDDDSLTILGSLPDILFCYCVVLIHFSSS